MTGHGLKDLVERELARRAEGDDLFPALHFILDEADEVAAEEVNLKTAQRRLPGSMSRPWSVVAESIAALRAR